MGDWHPKYVYNCTHIHQHELYVCLCDHTAGCGGYYCKGYRVNKMLSIFYFFIYKYRQFSKRVNENFWYYPKRAFCYALLIFTILSLTEIYGVRAQTGEEIFNQDYLFAGTDSDYSTFLVDAGTTTTCGNINGSIDRFDYNFAVLGKPKNIEFYSAFRTQGGTNVRITLLSTAAGIVTKGTTFNSYISGIYFGSGQLGWHRANYDLSNNTYYYWIKFENINETYYNTLSSAQTITFVYNNSIFNYYILFSPTGAICYNFKSVDANYPISVSLHAISSAAALETNSLGVPTKIETAYSHTVTQKAYNFTNFILLNLTKNNKNIEYIVQNQTGTVYYDVISASNVDENFSKETGIHTYLRDIISGEWVNRTIYSVLPPTVPTPYIPNGTSPSGQIAFIGNLNYSGIYGVQANLTSSNFSSWDEYYITVKKPDGTVPVGFPKTFSQQNYSTGLIGILDYGLWQANLSYCAWYWLCGFDTSQLIDTAKLEVTKAQYNFSLSTDKSVYFPGETLNLTIVNPSNDTVIVYFFNSYGYLYQYESTYFGSGTFYKNYNLSTGVDKYIIYMERQTTPDINDIVATAFFEIQKPSATSNFLSISWSGDIFGKMGDSKTLEYTSNYNSSTIHVIKNETVADKFTVSSNISGSKNYILDQIGDWQANISDGNTIRWANISVIGGIVTQCNKAMPDYICWENSTYYRNQPYLINYKVTTAGDLISSNFAIIIENPSGNIVFNKTWTRGLAPPVETDIVSGIFSKNDVTGTWRTALIKGGTAEKNYLDGKVLSQHYTVLSDQAVPTPTPTYYGKWTPPQEDISSVCAFWDGWVQLAAPNQGLNDATRFQFALLWIVIPMFFATIVSKSFSTGLAIGFFPYAFFLYLSLSTPCGVFMPTWTAIFIALIIGIKMRWFM